jgi:dTDP-4-amino-4,6-dideoxygalactose transaminase
MDFIDLKAQQARIRGLIEDNIRAVLDHGKYVMGPEIQALEDKLGDFVGSRHAVACSSGTDALLMALMALDIGPGDAVFTTPFTFIATAEVISLLGAVPVFVDIDPQTFNIDPDKLEDAVEALRSGGAEQPALPGLPNGRDAKLTPRAIIAVDLFGLPCDYDRLEAVAERFGLELIEDAAQSFGAEFRYQKACSFGDVACTSFFPAKPLGCYGDGGMVFTRDDDLAERLQSIRIHGQGRDKYENVRIGINGRLDTIQAAVLLAKFDIFPEEIEARGEVAKRYSRLLSDGGSELVLPLTPQGYKSVWAQYSVLAKSREDRAEIQEKLKKAGVPTAVYYPTPLHLQTAYASLGYAKGAFPVSEDAADRIFSLPMHPYLNERDQRVIVDAIIQFGGDNR